MLKVLVLFSICLVLGGCAFRVTAVPLSKEAKADGDVEGIPYYLPQPYLVVTKNIATTMTEYPPPPSTPLNLGPGNAPTYPPLQPGGGGGGTGGGKGDKSTTPSTQADGGGASGSPATGGAAGSPGASPPKAPAQPSGPAGGGTEPTPRNQTVSGGVFFTYQVIYLPNLKQKYGLRLKGNAGQISTVLRLIHGWQFQGIESLSLSNSTTGETILASGHALTQVMSGLAPLIGGPGVPKAQAEPSTATSVKDQPVPSSILAGIYVFEIEEATGSGSSMKINPTPVMQVEFTGDLRSSVTPAEPPDSKPGVMQKVAGAIIGELAKQAAWKTKIVAVVPNSEPKAVFVIIAPTDEANLATALRTEQWFADHRQDLKQAGAKLFVNSTEIPLG